MYLGHEIAALAPADKPVPDQLFHIESHAIRLPVRILTPVKRGLDGQLRGDGLSSVQRRELVSVR